MAAMAQFHWDPATYRSLMRSEVPAYDELQDAVAGATRGFAVHRRSSIWGRGRERRPAGCSPCTTALFWWGWTRATRC